ncbi:MAG: hypothetical protein WA127_02240 [Methanothrix sp.]
MIRAFLVLMLVVSTAHATVWGQGVSGELHWKEQLTLEDYTLTLADFSMEEKLMVLVELQDDGRPIARRALHAGEWFVINDSLRISALKIAEEEDKDEPYAIVRMQLPSAPEISLILSFDKDLYRGGEDIKMLLSVENRGAVDAEDLRIIVDSNPPIFSRWINMSILQAGSAWDDRKKTAEIDPIRFDLVAPYLLEAGDLQVKVHAQYTDPDGNSHQSWGGGKTHISGPLRLFKRVEEAQELSESYYVINSISNSANRTFSVDLSDSTGKEFHSNETLQWKIVLEPGQTKIVSYCIKPIEPAMGISLPDAVASFRMGERIYTIHSNRPVVDVTGPLIDAKRSISPKRVKAGEEVVISLELENQGNRKAVLTMAETVPQGAELISGELNESFMLSPGEKAARKIRLRVIDPDGISIPSSMVRYRDVRGNDYSTRTSALRVTVEEEEVNSPSNASRNDTGGSGMSKLSDPQDSREDDPSPDRENRDDERLIPRSIDNRVVESGSGLGQRISILLIIIILLLSVALGRYL